MNFDYFFSTIVKYCSDNKIKVEYINGKFFECENNFLSGTE